MNIAVQDARGMFTNMLIAALKEKLTPTAFFRSFFPTVESATKNISIEVSRGTEKIAVDVLRGTEGNRHKWSKSTEKIFSPTNYRDYFELTELDLYDRLFASGGTISESVFADLIRSAAERTQELKDGIERAYEKQCADVLLDGIVQRSSDLNIDYNRKAGSLVDLASTTGYWSSSAAFDVYKTLEDAAYFLRTEGKTMGSMFNVIMGGAALRNFQKNTEVRARQDLKNVQWDSLRAPQRNSVGGALHGQVSAGAYTFNLMSYPEIYENKTGTKFNYMDDKKIIVLPEVTNFKLAFAAVPQLINGNQQIVKGAFKVDDYIDERLSSHIIDVKSAGLAVPVAVDQIYTAQVIA